jgi:hypothetical protein
VRREIHQKDIVTIGSPWRRANSRPFSYTQAMVQKFRFSDVNLLVPNFMFSCMDLLVNDAAADAGIGGAGEMRHMVQGDIGAKTQPSSCLSNPGCGSLYESRKSSSLSGSFPFPPMRTRCVGEL